MKYLYSFSVMLTCILPVNEIISVCPLTHLRKDALPLPDVKTYFLQGPVRCKHKTQQERKIFKKSLWS